MSNAGFRVNSRRSRPDAGLVEAFKNIPVANIADGMNRTFCIAQNIRPFNQSGLIGSAFTVKTRPGDNLVIHKAIDMAQPGDVIVIDGQGDLSNALIGELMITWAQRRGIAGFIIDGAIRDVNVVKQLSIPVYAAGVTPAGPYKDGPGEVNVPVSCGGVVVQPGNLLVGDEDGVVVINGNDAQEILKKATEKSKAETQTKVDIENGTWDRSWVDRVLKAKGCEFIE